MAIHVAEDGQGQIWGDTSTGAVRFNPRTGEWREFKSVTQPGFTYGAVGDRDGNGWWTQFGIDIVGHADIETGKVSESRLPPARHAFLQEGDLSAEDLPVLARQGPRRLGVDVNGVDVWVPNFKGNTLMRINIETMRTTFYPLPRVGLNPYVAAVDTSHNVWVSFLGGVTRSGSSTRQRSSGRFTVGHHEVPHCATWGWWNTMVSFRSSVRISTRPESGGWSCALNETCRRCGREHSNADCLQV